GSCLILAFGAGGADGSGGLLIWPLFGTTNQLLAGLTLLVIAVMLVRKRVTATYVIVPLAFLLLMTLAALLIQLHGFYLKEDWFLFGLDLIVLVAAILVTLECVSALRSAKRKLLAANEGSIMDGIWSRLKPWGEQANTLGTQYYNAPYRGAIARATREEDDLFMLLVFSEMMGVPNPASRYTLE